MPHGHVETIIAMLTSSSSFALIGHRTLELYYFILLFYFILFYFILFYFILFYFILFYFILFYFILFYFILFYFILFYFILFYFILFYFILFYFILLNTSHSSPPPSSLSPPQPALFADHFRFRSLPVSITSGFDHFRFRSLPFRSLPVPTSYSSPTPS